MTSQSKRAATTTPRSAVNMPAIGAQKVVSASSTKKWKDAAMLSSLVLAVTAGGVAVGALGIAPLLENEPVQRLRNASESVIGLAFQAADAIAANSMLTAATGAVIVSLVAAVLAYRWLRNKENAGALKIRRRQAPAGATMLFSARTPRDVQVLAAAGQAPTEIAARTRLSVDAVSMLLQIGQNETMPAAR